MDRTIEHTARALASLGSKDHGPSKGFQALIRLIGEAKTKHVSFCLRVEGTFMVMIAL